MAFLSPQEMEKRGNYIIHELNGWSILQKIHFLLYLVNRLLDQLQRGIK